MRKTEIVYARDKMHASSELSTYQMTVVYVIVQIEYLLLSNITSESDEKFCTQGINETILDTTFGLLQFGLCTILRMW